MTEKEPSFDEMLSSRMALAIKTVMNQTCISLHVKVKKISTKWTRGNEYGQPSLPEVEIEFNQND